MGGCHSINESNKEKSPECSAQVCPAKTETEEKKVPVVVEADSEDLVEEKSNQKAPAARPRRAGVSAQVLSAKDMADWKKPVYDKGPETRQLLKEIIAKNQKVQVLFGHMSADQLDEVITAMFPKKTEVGDKLIRQGDVGDAFWIVESGLYHIFVNRESVPKSDSDPLGDKVFECASGACFGELALMYNAPRAATVVTTTPGMIWGLDRQSFQMMIQSNESSKKDRYEGFLDKVDILNTLNKYEKSTISDCLGVVEFKKDDIIMRQGDDGKFLYILEKGEAKAYMSDSSTNTEEICVKTYTSPGEYFGELALILNAPRKATVRASGDSGCVVLALSKDKFDRVLGPIKHRLNIADYPQYAEALLRVSGNSSPAQTPVGDDPSPVSDSSDVDKLELSPTKETEQRI